MQGVDEDTHASEVVRLIRENKSLSKEIKILREAVAEILRMTGIKCDEFEAYNKYVKDCIEKASKDTI